MKDPHYQVIFPDGIKGNLYNQKGTGGRVRVFLLDKEGNQTKKFKVVQISNLKINGRQD